MQGQGNQSIEGMVFEQCDQPARTPVGNSQLVPVLQGMNDAVDREVVAECSNGHVEMWRVFQAGAAALAVRGLISAERAAMRR